MTTVGVLSLTVSAQAQRLIEVPGLTEAVRNGQLPPIEKRVPKSPAIVGFEEDIQNQTDE